MNEREYYIEEKKKNKCVDSRFKLLKLFVDLGSPFILNDYGSTGKHSISDFLIHDDMLGAVALYYMFRAGACLGVSSIYTKQHVDFNDRICQVCPW